MGKTMWLVSHKFSLFPFNFRILLVDFKHDRHYLNKLNFFILSIFFIRNCASNIRKVTMSMSNHTGPSFQDFTSSGITSSTPGGIFVN